MKGRGNILVKLLYQQKNRVLGRLHVLSDPLIHLQNLLFGLLSLTIFEDVRHICHVDQVAHLVVKEEVEHFDVDNALVVLAFFVVFLRRVEPVVACVMKLARLCVPLPCSLLLQLHNLVQAHGW